MRILIIKLRCGKKVHIYPIQPMRISSQLMIKKKAQIVIIGKKFKLERNTTVRVIDGGSLIIGNSCFVNCGAFITVMGKTTIGNHCQFGPGVLIFDHDHDFRANGGIKSGKMKIGEIFIGNNVWIGGNSIILRGTHIGDNAIIAAGSIIKGNVPANTLYIQKRITEMINI